MGLGKFAAWFACQVEIDDSRATADRALSAAVDAQEKGSHRIAGHLQDVFIRESYRADFIESIQKGFEEAED